MCDDGEAKDLLFLYENSWEGSSQETSQSVVSSYVNIDQASADSAILTQSDIESFAALEDNFVSLHPLYVPQRSNLNTAVYESEVHLRHWDNETESLQSPAHVSASVSTNEILRKIESVFERVLDALLSREDRLSIPLKTKAIAAQKSDYCKQGKLNSTSNEELTEVTFPGSTAQEAWRFSVVIRILELIHEALAHNIVITKRDIYYKDPALFGRQGIVDRYVDDVARTLGVSRQSLNVVATAKGLFAGAISVRRKDGIVIESSEDSEGILIPSMREVQSIDSANVRWILVIEKEATFRALVERTLWKNPDNCQGLLVTAKGYPDLSTRSFLRSIATPSPENNLRSIPVFALMDFDPDGIGILATYKYGSIALSHENEALNLPSITWLGLRSFDVLCNEDAHSNQGLMRLTARDRRKATKMLEWDVFSEGGLEPEWREQLQTMLMLNVKGEIQLMDARAEGLVGWLSGRLMAYKQAFQN